MKVNQIITVILFLSISTLSAQTLGEFKPGKSGPKTLESRKFDSKEVFIADFAVHYQVYAEESTTNEGGTSFVKGIMGKAKASLAVGLDIPTATIEKITNETYANFVDELKAQGFNILNPEVAKNTNYYKDYKYSTNLAMIPSPTKEGAVLVHPQNIGFFYKEKGANASYTKLSTELNDAAVIRVDVYIDFVKMGDFNKGFGASVNAKTNLVMSEQNTIIHFVVGRNKIGGSPLAEYQGIIKKDLEIDGVIKEEKITSYAQSDYDNKGVETAFGTLYTAKNTTSSKVALVPADANKYEMGVTEALNVFLEHHIKEFYSKFYKK